MGNLNLLRLPDSSLEKIIESHNLGPIRYMEPNGDILQFPSVTGNYDLILTNKLQNYLRIPVLFYGWEGDIYGGEFVHGKGADLADAISKFYTPSGNQEQTTYIEELL